MDNAALFAGNLFYGRPLLGAGATGVPFLEVIRSPLNKEVV